MKFEVGDMVEVELYANRYGSNYTIAVILPCPKDCKRAQKLSCEDNMLRVWFTNDNLKYCFYNRQMRLL